MMFFLHKEGGFVLMKKQNGVSLIALIITIIVIIFLAVIIIGAATSTPEKANTAKFVNDVSEVQQAVSTKLAENQMQYITNPENVDLNSGFTRIKVIGEPDDFQSFPLESGEDGTVQGYLINLDTIKMERATIGQGYIGATEVEFGITDAFVYDVKGEVYYAKGYKDGERTYYTKQDTTETNTQPVEQEDTSLVKGVNPPILGAGMVKVYWDEFNSEINSENSEFDISNWYDYVAQTGDTINGGTSKWANVIIDGSYFVWVPRYAYKITYYSDEEKQTVSESPTTYGNIDVLFMHGTSSTKYIDRATNSEVNLPSGYVVHPAFTSNMDQGGWDSELTGIWVAKYEASHSDATNLADGTNLTLKVVPNVKSWVSLSVGDLYTIAIEYNSTLNSHLMKNSEWGAVAYLTHSKYGRNSTEISINNNGNRLTGYASVYSYNTSRGARASTTGNIYGIYDLSGGAFEYVPAYYSGGTSDTLSNGTPFVYKEGTTINTSSTKYVTVYSGIDESSNYKLGDATYETGSWYIDFNNFLSDGYPWFVRGGNYYCSGSAGAFAMTCGTGGASVDNGFRPVLVTDSST
jgi:hypothetical protein